MIPMNFSPKIPHTNRTSGIRKRNGFFSIRVRTALFAWLISIAAITIFVLKVIPQQKEIYLNALQSKARVLDTSIHDIAASAIVTEDYSEVVDHCMEILGSNPSVCYLVLTRNDGFSLIHTRTGWSLEDLDGPWQTGFGSTNGRILYSKLINEEVFHLDTDFQYSGLNWGRLHVGLSLDEYHAGVHAIYRQTVLVALFCVVAGLLSSLIFANRLVKPILTLESTVQRVATGNLDIRADIHSGDEVENLAHAFNHMTQSIQDRETQVRAQNRALSALATEKTLHSGNIIEAAELITEVSARTLNIQRVSVWLLEKSASELACVTLYSIDNKCHRGHRAVQRAGNEAYFDALQESRVLAITDALTDPRTKCLADAYLMPAEATSMLDAVIRIDGAVVGVVCHEHTGTSRSWSAEEENFAGSIANLMALALEARDRRRAQEELLAAKNAAEAASEAKSRFLATMSHEIRTPLNGVVGMLKLLRNSDLNTKQERFVHKGVLSSEALLNVINDILDFSKIEAGRLELERVRFNVVETVENVVQMFAQRAEEQYIELACSISDSVPRQVIGDPNRLGQVLINLLGNAHKFTKKGEIIVDVHCLQETQQQIELEFKVRDTGKGISAHDKERIFEPFLQEDNSTTRRFGGTGLGLGISRQLVGLMDGTIGVESTPGHGSTFSFTVMLSKAPPKKSEPHPLNGMRGRHALIVDDHAITREIIAYQLKCWNCISSTAGNGTTALQQIREQTKHGTPFDFVIIDWNMPKMNGEELCRRIKDDPALADLPLILLSSVGGMHPNRLKELGINAWIAKPARQSELHDAIINVMNHADTASSNDIAPTDEWDSHRKNIRILLAEDNEINQEVAVEILLQNGFTCDIASNGNEAVEAIEKNHYDLIFMDCMMPEMDGYDATRTIRSIEKSSGRHHPIIALTANAMKGDRETCLEAGMDDYLSKPLDPDEVVAMISKWHLDTQVENKPVFKPEPTPTIQNLAIFDRADVVRRCMGNEALVDKLLVQFQTQIEHDMTALEDALSSNDHKTAQLIAHRIKGAAANLSMGTVRKTAEEIETNGYENDLEAAADGFLDLRAAVEQAKQSLTQL
jgi:signal transduction histidine kinase/CheY-like chemotaxis protein